MGCCSAKRKLHTYDDSCYVCDNSDAHDSNIYTLQLLKCYPKYPAINDFTNKPYYNHSIAQKALYRNQNFNDHCLCGCMETGYLRLDSIKPTQNSECTTTDDEGTKSAPMMPSSTKQCYSLKRYCPESTSEELSTISYECKSSDSYLRFRCQCIHSKTHRYHKINDKNVIENSNKKDIGIQKESEISCTMKEQYDDYVEKMEKSWYCCYNILHEIKELLSRIDEYDCNDLTNDSPIDDGIMYALPYAVSVCSGILENNCNETKYEVNSRPSSI